LADIDGSGIGVPARQCIGGRIADRETLEREVAAWRKDRDAAKAKVNWRFTSDEARIRPSPYTLKSNVVNTLE